ncbi:MAG: HPr family phosphocarrier protein [Alkalispirochaeta sp.]
MKNLTVTIKHTVGLHARPAARFVKIAKGFQSDITIQNITRGGEEVDAKSLVKVIKLAASQNHEVALSVSGDDEDAAVAALQDFFTNIPETEQ